MNSEGLEGRAYCVVRDKKAGYGYQCYKYMFFFSTVLRYNTLEHDHKP